MRPRSISPPGEAPDASRVAQPVSDPNPHPRQTICLLKLPWGMFSSMGRKSAVLT